MAMTISEQNRPELNQSKDSEAAIPDLGMLVPLQVKDEERDVEEKALGTSSSPSLNNVDNEGATGFDGWKSVDDPANPLNWSFAKKVFHTAVPALYGFVITIATSAYVPAIPMIVQRFGVGREVAILPLSLYTLGFTLGPLFAAPLSELYGRRPVYWVSMALLLVFIAIAGAANNIAVLVIFRFLAGAGGSGILAVGAGTIADCWSIQARGIAAIFYIISPFLGPALGPLTGAYIISEYDDWRYSQWVVLFLAAPVALMALFMQETSKQRILYLRTKNSKAKVVHKKGDTANLLHKIRIAITRPLHMMLFEPLVAYLSIYTGFSFAMMFSFFGSYSYVFRSVYGFNDKQVGLTFIGILVGFFFALASFRIFDATLFRRAEARANGHAAPEHRLYAALLGSFMLPIGLFWFAWAPRHSVHWIVPVLAGVPFGWGCLSIFISATIYLVDVYLAANSASAVAANGMLRYGLGAAFPLFTLQMYEAMGIHWAGSVFAFVGLAMLPVPWVFFKWGKQLRERSVYETNRD